MICCVKVLNDERLSKSSYAEGDHYNEIGRALITKTLAGTLRKIVEGGQS